MLLGRHEPKLLPPCTLEALDRALLSLLSGGLCWARTGPAGGQHGIPGGTKDPSHGVWVCDLDFGLRLGDPRCYGVVVALIFFVVYRLWHSL